MVALNSRYTFSVWHLSSYIKHLDGKRREPDYSMTSTRVIPLIGGHSIRKWFIPLCKELIDLHGMASSVTRRLCNGNKLKTIKIWGNVNQLEECYITVVSIYRTLLRMEKLVGKQRRLVNRIRRVSSNVKYNRRYDNLPTKTSKHLKMFVTVSLLVSYLNNHYKTTKKRRRAVKRTIYEYKIACRKNWNTPQE